MRTGRGSPAVPSGAASLSWSLVRSPVDRQRVASPCRPRAGTAVEHADVPVAAAGEDAGAGHGAFTVPAHHGHRALRDGAGGEVAELEIDGAREVTDLELGALAYIDHGAD